MTGKPKLFIATPSARDWKVGYGTSMIHLTAHLTAKILNHEMDGMLIRCQPASLLSVSRQMLLNDALAGGFTHILWIDDDTQFSEKAVDLMLSRDVDYVALNFCRRTFPLSFTAHELGTMSPIDSSQRTGIEEVYQVGLGMCLIKLDAVRDIPGPHFEVKISDIHGTYIGEDTYFCHKLRDKGIKLYVDHDASMLVQHIGDFGYGFGCLGEKKTATEIKVKEAA